MEAGVVLVLLVLMVIFFDRIFNRVNDGNEITMKSTTNTPSEDKQRYESADLIAIDKRHRSVEALSSAANFFGWLLIVTIIGIPLGISLLLFGHMTKAAIETEYNSRENSHVLKQILKELKKPTPARSIHK